MHGARQVALEVGERPAHDVLLNTNMEAGEYGAFYPVDIGYVNEHYLAAPLDHQSLCRLSLPRGIVGEVLLTSYRPDS